ncbi:prepilin-type N-terminal cleavage/methylation domain-containing protein [Oscillatoria sp. CS-180]|uniref:prepilin-type N-terminal cleavage/methylation domain-containing protein n=1 Tax=Oscillatoria sp. CS-180 TaxID=3021720 RepID=UPI00232E6373|nr:prepilin-type N-terminal cleavage/methylation domain-containing protein [Oscillatoria sp. CS-180]MDB9527758.1 prepilin-type N-terminal cleavage/methylation domain-containing protein [Oscillatoria sp. CS-180]
MKPLVPQKRTSLAGYTLVELLVVVIIVAVLAAIAAPSWLRYMNSQRIGAVRSDLVQVIRQAQQDAIQRRQRVKVTINTASDLPSVNVDRTVDTDVLTAGDGRDIALAPSDGIRPGMIIIEPPEQGGSEESIIFDYQGMVREQANLPYVIDITVDGSNRKQCVIVSNIIGSIKSARDGECP